MTNRPDAPTDARFLRRWSRRKAAAVAGESPAAESAGAAGAAGPAGASAADREELPAAARDANAAGPAAEPAPPPLTDAHMPPLERLDADSDFSGFLSPGVSEGLRRQALRKLFRSAIFNARDGLDDYDDDFRHFPPLGDHITSDMKHRMEMEAERAKAEAAEGAESPDESEEESVADTVDSPPDESAGATAPTESTDSPESTSPPAPTDSTPAPTR
ncbi:MAG: DUF3306 domain-containing protein [Gammaproteobacteria bacterium]|nr:DUF3306 domain-containing protein [Gammaproteobacteria bacterium]